MNRLNVKREQLVRIFFLGFFAFLLMQVLLILYPFFTGILGAIVIVLIFSPMHKVVQQLLGKKYNNLAAVISTFLVFILLVVPFLWLTWLLLQEVTEWYPFIQTVSYSVLHWKEVYAIENSWLNKVLMFFSNRLGVTPAHLKSMSMQLLEQGFSFILEISKELPSHAFKMIVNVAVMHFVLFFLFRDGKMMYHKIRDLIPLENAHKDQIFNKIYITLTAIVRGVFLVALVQGILCAIGFFIVGVKSALLLGFICVLSALIPILGVTVVWLPIAVYYFYAGVLWKSIFLLVWGSVIVGLVDNFLRIILIGGGAKLPTLVIFFGLLGGLKMYGPKGIFLGPLVVALSLAFMRIYKEIYDRPEKALPPPSHSE